MRFTTVELGDLEGKLAQAGERALAMEFELFEDLVTEATGGAADISLAATLWRGLMFTYRLRSLLPSGLCWPMVDETSAFMSGYPAPVVEAALASVQKETLSPTTVISLRINGWLVTGQTWQVNRPSCVRTR